MITSGETFGGRGDIVFRLNMIIIGLRATFETKLVKNKRTPKISFGL
jgi:hypothetical protein